MDRLIVDKKNDPEIIRPYKRYLFGREDEGHHGGRHQSVTQTFETTIREIFGSHSYELSRLVKNVVGGAIVASGLGFLSLFTRHNYRRFHDIRRLLSTEKWKVKKMKGFALQGAFAGAVWYIWYWSLLHPHGTRPSFYSNMLGISLYSAVMASFFMAPAAFPYALFFGFSATFPIHYIMNPDVYPGFQMPVGKLTQEQRDKIRYEDILTDLGSSAILDNKNYIIPQ